jgi:NADP-dependent 3-hydroxy acid dehydrogenase YdfG
VRASWSPTSTPTPRRPWPAGLGNADKAIAVTANVTDPIAVQDAVDAAALRPSAKPFDLVVNNAGLSISKPLLETTKRTGTCSTM